ncbi:hypothetical protein [Allosphingosinicella sp.]|uniref:hypothetical protein n=1 Tax=Allosphingosinicella sp. TaxID=2823234 RepID=UPI002FC17B73
MTAQEALVTAAKAALASLAGVGVYDGFPGAGIGSLGRDRGRTRDGLEPQERRRTRIAAGRRSARQGETPARLRRLMGEAEGAIAGMGGMAGWSFAMPNYLRCWIVREGGEAAPQAWAGVIEFRVRMLAAGSG